MGTEPKLELLSPEAERGKEQRNVEMRTKGRKEKGKVKGERRLGATEVLEVKLLVRRTGLVYSRLSWEPR